MATKGCGSGKSRGNGPGRKQSQAALKDITKERRQELQKAFRVFDKSGDGSISIHELKKAMQILGNNPTDKDVRKIMKAADKDGNGSIDFEEFAVLMLEHLKQPAEEQQELLESFRVFDKDDSGYIEVDELKQVMKAIGERLSDEQVKKIFAMGDLDGDGRLDYQEFVQLMTQSPLGNM